MYLAILNVPYIDKSDDDEIHWESRLLVIDVFTKNEAMIFIGKVCPPREKQIEEDLVRYHQHKPGEYFIARLYAVPVTQKIVALGTGRDVVFPGVSESIKF